MEELDVENKLRQLKDMRDKQLIMESNGTNRVENTQYLGKVNMTYEIDGQIFEQEKDIYVVKENIDGKTLNKVYTSDMEVLGIYDEEKDIFIPSEKNMDKMELIDEIQELNNGDSVIDLEDITNNKLELVAATLGVEKEEIKKIQQLDVKQEIDLDEDLDKQAEIIERSQDEKQLSEKKAEEVIDASGKQEIKLSTKVNDKKTLGDKLNLINDTESEFDKIIVVETDALNNVANDTRYSFIAQRKDGTAKVIDDVLEFDQETGSNAMEESVKIDADGTARKDRSTNSRFKIRGTRNYLSVENAQYGELKVHYGEGKTHDGNMPVETQLETSSVWPVDREIREQTQGENKGREKATDMFEEGEKHFEEANEEKISYLDVDGNEETKTHEHIENDDLIIDEIARRLIKNDEIDRVFTFDECKEEAKKFLKENKEDMENIEEKIEELENILEEEASRIPTQEHTMDTQNNNNE